MERMRRALWRRPPLSSTTQGRIVQEAPDTNPGKQHRNLSDLPNAMLRRPIMCGGNEAT